MSVKQKLHVPGSGFDALGVASPTKESIGNASKGQTQAMGMQGKAGGGNAQAQALIANSQDLASNTVAESEKADAAAAKTGVEHYTVEICAWIPHSRVVDPEEMLRSSDWLDTITDLTPTLLAAPNYEYDSHYRGDNHVGYDVSKVRVWARIDFDWDGSAISGVKVTGDTGATHRDWSSSLDVETLGGFGPTMSLGKSSGTETGKAPAGASGSGTGKKFKISFSSANPLVITMAPAINSTLTGTIDPTGGLDLDFSTDLFPSHGIQVERNGATVLQKVVRDASGVPGEGAAGAAAIGAFLSAQLNDGKENIP